MQMKLQLKSLHTELKEKDQEVQDRDEICEFLRGEIRKHDNRQKVQEAMINNDAKSLLNNMASKEEELSDVSCMGIICMYLCAVLGICMYLCAVLGIHMYVRICMYLCIIILCSVEEETG